jgi:hypothetical protein
MTLSCPLCHSVSPQPIAYDENYILCKNCNLIYLHPHLRVDPETERKRYLLHQNNSEKQGYIDFLNKIIVPALLLLDSGMSGLDYGCGPSPVLSGLLQKKGIGCENYDPFFFPKVLQNQYQFIISTECFEHFYDPFQEITKITHLISPRGYLMIMTEWWQDLDHFKNWHYKRDYTHVCFYHYSTMQYISKNFGFKIVYKDLERVVIFQKIPF